MNRKRTRHRPDQILEKLREADAMLNGGASVSEVVEVLQISEATFHRWRNQYGGIKGSDAQRLKQLENENQTLRKRLSDLVRDNEMLKELSLGNW